jgi:hypothetical protein
MSRHCVNFLQDISKLTQAVLEELLLYCKDSLTRTLWKCLEGSDCTVSWGEC